VTEHTTSADFAQIPFLRWLGAELVLSHGGVAEIALDLREEHTNSFHVGHGGVLMTLLDVAMARAVRSVEPGPVGVITVEMKTSFFRPATGRLITRGRILHRSRTLSYCEAELMDAGGQLAAKAMGTFKVVKRTEYPLRDRRSAED
jgi:uncharacterized protein (TIGR00369 family)